MHKLHLILALKNEIFYYRNKMYSYFKFLLTNYAP